jgi:hypothetical protein
MVEAPYILFDGIDDAVLWQLVLIACTTYD